MKVEFIVTKYNLKSSRYINVLTSVFPIKREQIDEERNLKIRCNSDDFVRFLFERNRRNLSNDFKSLELKLLAPEPFDGTKIDLTGDKPKVTK